MKLLAACLLSIVPGLSLATGTSFVHLGGASSGLAHTCSPSPVVARALGTINIPAGASYEYSISFLVMPDPNAGDMGMMMMEMMMGSGPSDPYYALIYNSPLRKGPLSASTVSLDLSTPAAWYKDIPSVPDHTQMMAQITTHSGVSGTADTSSMSTLSWDCTTGAIARVTNDGAAANVPQPTNATPAVEFYNPSLDHYFVTSSASEISVLDASGPGGWARTGLGFNVLTDAASGATPVCRFYIPPQYGDSHFYSAAPTECASVQAQFPTFMYESPSIFYINVPDYATGTCPSATIPVYRLWNARPDSNHRYTTDPTVKAEMISRGYVPEGYGADAVAMCASL